MIRQSERNFVQPKLTRGGTNEIKKNVEKPEGRGIESWIALRSKSNNNKRKSMRGQKRKRGTGRRACRKNRVTRKRRGRERGTAALEVQGVAFSSERTNRLPRTTRRLNSRALSLAFNLSLSLFLPRRSVSLSLSPVFSARAHRLDLYSQLARARARANKSSPRRSNTCWTAGRPRELLVKKKERAYSGAARNRQLTYEICPSRGREPAISRRAKDLRDEMDGSARKNSSSVAR